MIIVRHVFIFQLLISKYPPSMRMNFWQNSYYHLKGTAISSPAKVLVTPTEVFLRVSQGFTKRCLSWLTNCALVYEPKGGGGGCGVSANEYSCAHEAQINFGDLTPYPYLIYGVFCNSVRPERSSFTLLYK
jgi:hypothetical protein